MKKRKFDLINILKYAMVVVFIAYIALLVSQENTDDVPVKTISQNMLKVTNTDGMSQGTTQDLKKYYGLNANDYDGVMLYIPDDVMSVNEILVVKLKNQEQANEVEQAVKKRLKTQKSSFEGYGVNQTKLLNSAITETKGNYVMMVISEDAEKIFEAFKNSI
ncbi:MAG: DUF4358 domain-containing protein [Dorea sp.]|nr:DUF4358 domain-containing protein [Dorea sp.]